MRLCIRGGRIVDPASGRDEGGDLFIENGRIVEALSGPADRVLEADGCIVAPGFVDMHVHLREPGQEWKEDIRTGSRAAVAGGVTTICCMPNTDPVLDEASVVRAIVRRAHEVGLCDVRPIGAITRGLQGKQLTEMRELARAGCVAFSDDGRPVADAGVMRRAMEYAASFGYLLIQHAEEPSLSLGTSVNEGWISTCLGVLGAPTEAESVMVARDALLMRRTGCRYHVAHISAADSVAIVREAQSRGLPISAEAAPHHFALTDEAVLGFNPNAKMNPPLRSEADRQAVIEGLRDGTIAVIATDHAPHHEDEKLVGLECAAFGIVGLQTLLPISLELVRQGALTLSEMIAKITCNPARLLGLDVGTLAPGARADVCVFDPEARWTLTEAVMESKSKNSPWLGKELQGKVIWTIFAGRIVYEEGHVREDGAA